mgnify:CR=1 FL=1
MTRRVSEALSGYPTHQHILHHPVAWSAVGEIAAAMHAPSTAAVSAAGVSPLFLAYLYLAGVEGAVAHRLEHARVLVALVSDAFSTSPDCLAELGHALERDLRRDQAESARPAHEHHAQSRACGLAS